MLVKDDLHWFCFWDCFSFQQFRILLYCWICKKYRR